MVAKLKSSCVFVLSESQSNDLRFVNERWEGGTDLTGGGGGGALYCTMQRDFQHSCELERTREMRSFCPCLHFVLSSPVCSAQSVVTI